MDLVQSLLLKEVNEVSRSMVVLFLRLRIECRADVQPEATIVLILEVDDSLLLGDELSWLVSNATI